MIGRAARAGHDDRGRRGAQPRAERGERRGVGGEHPRDRGGGFGGLAEHQRRVSRNRRGCRRRGGVVHGGSLRLAFGEEREAPDPDRFSKLWIGIIQAPDVRSTHVRSRTTASRFVAARPGETKPKRSSAGSAAVADAARDTRRGLRGHRSRGSRARSPARPRFRRGSMIRPAAWRCSAASIATPSIALGRLPRSGSGRSRARSADSSASSGSRHRSNARCSVSDSGRPRASPSDAGKGDPAREQRQRRAVGRHRCAPITTPASPASAAVRMSSAISACSRGVIDEATFARPGRAGGRAAGGLRAAAAPDQRRGRGEPADAERRAQFDPVRAARDRGVDPVQIVSTQTSSIARAPRTMSSATLRPGTATRAFSTVVCAARVGDRIGEARQQAERADIALRVEREEADLDAADRIAAQLGDMPDHLFARRLRRRAGAHRRDDARRAGDARDFLAEPGRGGTADAGLDVQARPDLRRIADPAAHLERHAGGRAGARQPPVGSAREQADRVMVERAAGRARDAVLAIGFGLVFRGLAASRATPFRTPGVSSDCCGKPWSRANRVAPSPTSKVCGVLSITAPRDRDRVHRVLQRGDRADTAGIVHDDRVERDVAVAVGIAANSRR